jgi:hypothetical protein
MLAYPSIQIDGTGPIVAAIVAVMGPVLLSWLPSLAPRIRALHRAPARIVGKSHDGRTNQVMPDAAVTQYMQDVHKIGARHRRLQPYPAARLEQSQFVRRQPVLGGWITPDEFPVLDEFHVYLLSF